MPRRTPLTVIGLLIVLASIGIGVSFFGIEYPKQVALSGPESRSATGVISALGQETSGRYTGYYSDVEFADESGRLFHLRAFYPKTDWDNLHQGSAVTVRYLAKDPDTAVEPNSYKGKRDPKVMLAIDCGLLLLGIVLILLARKL